MHVYCACAYECALCMLVAGAGYLSSTIQANWWPFSCPWHSFTNSLSSLQTSIACSRKTSLCETYEWTVLVIGPSYLYIVNPVSPWVWSSRQLFHTWRRVACPQGWSLCSPGTPSYWSGQLWTSCRHPGVWTHCSLPPTQYSEPFLIHSSSLRCKVFF